eukprot:365830-Chlamydomonas_euryale.AAC.13
MCAPASRPPVCASRPAGRLYAPVCAPLCVPQLAISPSRLYAPVCACMRLYVRPSWPSTCSCSLSGLSNDVPGTRASL